MTTHNRKLLTVLACVLIGAFFTIWNSQVMNLARIERHISSITPRWEQFQSDNDGFEQVTFYAYTGGGGKFSAIGEVPTKANYNELEEFMKSTDPPRPIFLNALRVRESENKKLAELEAQTKKPNRSEMATPNQQSD